MRTTFFMIFCTFFYFSLFSQSERQNSVIEECFSIHLKYFSLRADETTDTIFICADSKRTTKYCVKDSFYSINEYPIFLRSRKATEKSIIDEFYPIYYMTIKKISKSELMLYIATMDVKRRNHKLLYGNTEANSSYLIENKHIKRITINGDIRYQE